MKAVYALIWVFYAALLAGWCLNIYHLATYDNLPTGKAALMAVGVLIAPLGSVLGWVL